MSALQLCADNRANILPEICIISPTESSYKLFTKQHITQCYVSASIEAIDVRQHGYVGVIIIKRDEISEKIYHAKYCYTKMLFIRKKYITSYR